ncbi:stage II sporulation protein R, partial [Bacillus glycinifermentans]
FSNGEAVKSPEDDQTAVGEQQEEKGTSADEAMSGKEKEDDKEVTFFLVEWITGLFS